MNIILEGPDNSGKSTLAQHIATRTGRTIIASEGPEKWPGEINERVRRYAIHNDVLFDRHPCVSQPIYGQIRKNTQVEPALLEAFYASSPLFIYCEGRGLEEHVLKDHDSEEHIRAVYENHQWLSDQYLLWALDHAALTYRIGNSIPDLLDKIEIELALKERGL